MSFSSLGLSSPLLDAVAELNFKNPYPIQEKAIPVILEGKDIFGIAQTGSGKTASFALPILEILLKKPIGKNRNITCLVMVPTRELAIQVAEVFQKLSSGLPLKVKTMAVYGGVSINPQIGSIQSTNILVATPGRLLELAELGKLQLNTVEILVLDEADKMLNLGFQEEMSAVFKLLPKKRQTLLFSATLKESINSIKDTLLNNPVLIEIEKEEQNLDKIEQIAYNLGPEKKGVFLRYLIKEKKMKQVLVFVSSTKKADNVVVKLNKNGIQAEALHSKKSQAARVEALNKFKSGKLRVLVATDLASRGLDIEFLPIVINYELPRSPIDYVHRIGRTGRADATGTAITLLEQEDHHHFYIIQKKMKKKVSILETNEIDLHGF